MITRVTLATRPLDLAVGHATRVWRGRTAFSVRIASAGASGEGEVVPLPGYGPDDAHAVRADLARFHEVDLAFDPEDGLPSAFDACCAGARAALSTAWLDLAAKHRGLALHAMLGGGRASVPVSMLVPIDDARAMHAALDRAVASGIRDLKVKIGAHVDAELAAVAALRARMPDARLRVDANGALPEDGYLAVLGRLADLGVVYVEEPVPLRMLDTVPRAPLPIAIDESLPHLDPARLRRWLESGVVGALVLKPSVLGGVDRALAYAHVAATHGVGASASHLFDGHVGLAAACELALASPLPLPAGVAPHVGLEAFPTRAIAALEASHGLVTPHATPGLGLGAPT